MNGTTGEKLGETEALEGTKRAGILGFNGVYQPTQALLSTFNVLLQLRHLSQNGLPVSHASMRRRKEHTG